MPRYPAGPALIDKQTDGLCLLDKAGTESDNMTGSRSNPGAFFHG